MGDYENWSVEALENWLACHEQIMAERERKADYIKNILIAKTLVNPLDR